VAECWIATTSGARLGGGPSTRGLKHALPGIDLAARSAAWSPWRGYAALHLWAGLSDGTAAE